MCVYVRVCVCVISCGFVQGTERRAYNTRARTEAQSRATEQMPELRLFLHLPAAIERDPDRKSPSVRPSVVYHRDAEVGGAQGGGFVNSKGEPRGWTNLGLKICKFAGGLRGNHTGGGGED